MFHLNLNLSQDLDLIGYHAPGTSEPLPLLKDYVTRLARGPLSGHRLFHGHYSSARGLGHTLIDPRCAKCRYSQD